VLSGVRTTLCGEVPELNVFEILETTKGVLSRSRCDVICYGGVVVEIIPHLEFPSLGLVPVALW
jgi:hypothetical protein